MRYFAFVLFVSLYPTLSFAQRDHPLYKVGMELRPPATLEGSPATLTWQNFKLVDLEGLKLIKDDEELISQISSENLLQKLRQIPLGQCLVADKRLHSKWYYVILQALTFLEETSRDLCRDTGVPLKFNSAVRHIPRQLEIASGENGLLRRNANAAPVSGPRASPHLTGASVDLAVVGVPQRAKQWLSERLLRLEELGLIDATLEDKDQKVYHVTVFREYLDK